MLFSVLRDCVGKDFTLKQVGDCNIPLIFTTNLFCPCCILQVYYGWRKTTLEFLKRMDPTLPFYYYTTSHERFYEGEMPTFDEQGKKPKSASRPPQRELLLSQVTRKASLPVRDSLTVRAAFHRDPVNLPS